MENNQFEFDEKSILRDSLLKLYSSCSESDTAELENIKKAVDDRADSGNVLHITQKDFPHYIMLGKANYPAKLFSDSPYNKILDVFSSNGSEVSLPVYFDMLGHSNIFVEYDSENLNGCFKFTHNIMWSFLSEIPVSKLSISIFDCERHGGSVTPFLEFRKKALDVFDNKIYTDRESIIDRLKRFNDEIDERIQTKLGTKYNSIVEYNNANPLRGEIIRLLVINDFPEGFDHTGLSLLANIIKNGPKCGTYTIINYNNDVKMSAYDKPELFLEQIRENSLLFKIEDGECYCRDLSAPVISDISATEAMTREFAYQYLEAMSAMKSSGLSICDIIDAVPFERTADESLTIPIGIGDGGHKVSLTLGTGSSHHALIAGATGSGKSTLLHTIILSTMMHYKPDEVNLYLMDFKSGTEFKIYDTYRLPHIKLLALDAMQEFGESILEDLVNEMVRRSSEFKKTGVTKLSEYTKASGNPMPRIIVVMDEFQILFNDSTNRKIANHCAELAKKIVTEGRSFGIHLLMATQSTAVISELSLSSGVIEQMRIRIGLKCGESDSRYLFKDNGAKALDMMKGDLGTAVLNPEYTEKENIGFKVAYSNDAVMNSLLKIIEEEFYSAEYTMQTFEGSRTKALLDCYSSQDNASETDAKVSIEVAEMIKVAPPLRLTFDKKRKHNILICGADERKSDNLYNVLMLSILKNRNSMVYCVDGDVFVDEDAFMPFYRQYERFDGRFRLAETNGDIISFVHEIFEAYKQRKKKKSDTTIFFFIRNLQFLELVKRLLKNEMIDESEYVDEDDLPPVEAAPDEAASDDNFFDFGISVMPEKSQGIAEEFSKLISEGTGFGIHFIITCPEYQVVKETMYYSENALSKFPERFIFNLNDNDSDALINGVSVSTLDENTVCYSDGISNVFQVKPYISPDAEGLKNYIDNGLTNASENDISEDKCREISANADNMTAAEKLDKLFGRKSKDNVSEQSNSAKGNSVGKLMALGYMYSKGYGVKQNAEYSRELYRKAAESGDVQSIFMLAKAYYFGNGVKPDHKLAAELFTTAADKGNAAAMNNLGIMYSKGEGVDQSFVLAAEWYQKAADNGYAIAMRNLGLAYYKGEGVPQNFELAFKWYQKAADNGNAAAMNNLGLAYSNGEGVDRDLVLAVEWYRKAVDNGNAAAMNNLGNAYYKGEGAPQDFALASEWYRKAADNGNVNAMKNLGDAYYKGEGAPQDFALAAEWYRKAADNGNAAAMFNLGNAYLSGEGAPQDFKLAAKWWHKAAENGNVSAMRNLGISYENGNGVPQDLELAAKWYQKAAENGNAAAMRNLGVLYENGKGVPQNYELAVKWYQKAAEKGDATAMFNLGNAYLSGEGAPQDFKLAAKWWHKAAENGNVSAMRNLGISYENGNGVPQDLELAAKWYQKAAENGNAAAMCNLGVLYKKGKGVPQNYELAAKWYQKAAENGNVNAMNNLGIAYENGEGVPQDYELAAKWYQKAAENGNAAAMCNLGILYNNGEGVPQDVELAADWYQKAAEWYQKAAENGDRSAYNNIKSIAKEMTSLGKTCKKNACFAWDYDIAVIWFRKAAALGDAEAIFELGDAYWNDRGIPQNYELAAKWYQKAAENGNVKAMNNLGFMYENGQGVPQNYGIAAKWYQKAADNGNVSAMNNLGFMYENGQGVPQNYELAAKWYQKAAENGNVKAMNNLGFMYENGQGVPQNYGIAAKWYQKAADNGNAAAMCNLGILYEDGKGVEQNFGLALQWYRKAADKDHADAVNNLGNAYYNGKGIERDYANAVHWFNLAADKGSATAMHNLSIAYTYGNGVEKDPKLAEEWRRKAIKAGYKPKTLFQDLNF